MPPLVQLTEIQVDGGIDGGILALFAVRLKLSKIFRRDRTESSARQIGRTGRSGNAFVLNRWRTKGLMKLSIDGGG